ncbi:olfactory receptor 6B1-like [Alosa alosa]|uniref:olfactory receptor 6B1-like n=1 Tax=Alosa alosa TaxID=278164 RepID=UPI0020151F0E|nr:olfactory receptor 6B1-like [Alosa alosa]
MEHQNNLYLTVFLLPYILTIAMNTLVIFVIYKERALHEPMYIFICNLSFKLSCTSTFVNNIVGLLTMGVYMFPQLLVILFSYAQILKICIHASKECRKKALQTCIPHLLTVINYFFWCLF